MEMRYFADDGKFGDEDNRKLLEMYDIFFKIILTKIEEVFVAPKESAVNNFKKLSKEKIKNFESTVVLKLVWVQNTF
jgi:hypothetical protein